MVSDGFDPLANTNFSLARRKTFFSFKIAIHDFHEQNNSFRLYVADGHRCYNYIGVGQQRKPKFSLPGEILTELLNSPPKKHYFLTKCRFAISRGHNNSFHHNLFPSCKHRHRHYIGIIQIFEQLRCFNFLKACVTSRCCVYET